MTDIEQENERLKAEIEGWKNKFALMKRIAKTAEGDRANLHRALTGLVTAAKVPASLYSGHYEIPIRQYMDLQSATREAERVLATGNVLNVGEVKIGVEGVAI